MEANFAPVLGVTENAGLFRFWCQKVLPAVYDDSLSYYELLCKVVNYLNDVIKTTDTTVENVSKLYSAFIRLQDYVNSYFDNLDVSNEINAKLDNMVANGEIGFAILNSIYTNRSKPLDMQKVIFVGDSYATRENSWVDRVIKLLGLNDGEYYKGVQGSAGFARVNQAGNNFLTLLQACWNGISLADRNEITHIIVCGGANDSLKSYDETVEAINKFVTWCKNNIPKAKIMIGAIGWTSNCDNMGAYTKAIEAYIYGAKNNGCVYLNNVQYTLHDYDLISEDKVHPTPAGFIELGDNIYSCIISGSCDIVKPYSDAAWIGADGVTIQVFSRLVNENVYVVSSLRNGYLYKPAEPIENYPATGQRNISLPLQTPKYIIGDTGFCSINCYVFVSYSDTPDGDTKYKACNGFIRFIRGFVYLVLYDADTTTGGFTVFPYLRSMRISPFNGTLCSYYC